MRIKPYQVSLLAVVLGGAVLISVVDARVLGLTDRDGDCISDLFQDLRTESDLVLTSGGEWKEVEIGYESSMNLPFTFFFASLLLICIPVLLYMDLNNRPLRRERMRRALEESAMQDNVRRISAFLQTNPSFPNAVRLAHLSQKGTGEKVLGKALWRSRTEGRTLEEVMLEMSAEWGNAVRSAVSGLISAQGESNPEELKRSSMGVVERLGEDVKEAMTTYTRSLGPPSTALFGLGVLLPVLLATMIPIAGLGWRTVVMIALVLWFVIPLLLIRISGGLVLRRPLLNEADHLTGPRFRPGPPDLVSFTAGSILLAFPILHAAGTAASPIIMDGPFPDTDACIILMSLVGASLILSALVRSLTREGNRAVEREEEEREKAPDLLSEIGSRLMEGASLERAVESGFSRIGERTPLMGNARAFHGSHRGAVADSLRVAEGFSSSGGRTGGSAVKALSRHLREMGRLERSMKEMIRSSVGQMEITSSLFAPLMIGASVGIFDLMDRSSSAAGADILGGSMGTGDMTIAGFMVLTGVYLILLSISTSVAIHRLEEGNSRGGFRKVPGNVLLASIMFACGVFCSTLVLGG